MLIHPLHGLWHAYRFAIAVPELVEGLTEIDKHDNICDSCEAQACLKTCPVNAFDGTRYDVKACFNYLQKTPDSVCHSLGCQAREACPEGEQSHYAIGQKRFHMNQFMQALQIRYGENSD
jgi:hypothetical protein